MTKRIVLVLVLLAGLVSSAFAVDKSHYYWYKVKDKYMKKICFEPTNLNNEWQRALHDATRKYNDTLAWRTKINFVFNYTTEVYCSYRVKVSTERNEDPFYSYLAITDKCHSWLKKPCDRIRINLANTYKIPYYTEKVALIMHEMGHVIGINHTGSGDGKKIPNTYNDPNYRKSLYRAGGIDDTYSGSNELTPNFTNYDIKSLIYLYGDTYQY